MGWFTKSYGEMTRYVKDTYDTTVNQIASLGISGMMHGYLVFDDMMIYLYLLEHGVTIMRMKQLRYYVKILMLIFPSVGVSHNFFNQRWRQNPMSNV